MSIHFVTLCWVILALFWIISAFWVKPVKERYGSGRRLAVMFLLAIGFLFLAGIGPVRHWWSRLNTRFLPNTLALRITGDFMMLVGSITALWARTVLAGNWSSSVTFKEGHELIERGPYRFVRHPIYAGILLMLLGTATISGRASVFLLLIICFIIYWERLRREEALLTKHFPETYPAYKARTKALIPFLF